MSNGFKILIRCIRKSYNKKIIFDVIVVFLLCAFYTFWFFDDLNKQGLYWDVALVGNVALAALRNIPYRGEVSLYILGRNIPLMLNQYNAGTDIYATMPWVYFLGNKPIALYMPGFIWGFLSIIFLYITCLSLYRDRLYSLLVSSMFATSSAFISASRLGIYSGNLTIFFALACVFFLFQWQEKKIKFWLFLMGLCMGMGISGKIQFLWFVISVLIYLILTKNIRKQFFTSYTNLIVIFSGIIIGAFSLILANMKSDFLTVRFLSKYFFVSREGISNINCYVDNLFERLKESIALIDGSGFIEGNGLIGSTLSMRIKYFNGIGFYLFILGMAFIILLKIYDYIKNRQVRNNTVIFPLLIFIIVILQSPITPTFLHIHHLILILPFMCMIACMPCCMLEDSVTTIKKSRMEIFYLFQKRFQTAIYTVVLLMSIIFVFNNYRLLKNYKIHRNIYGGQEVKWDIMSQVKNYFIEKKIKRILLGDSGLEDQLLFLSGFEFELKEIFYAHHKCLSEQEAERKLVETISTNNEEYCLFRTEHNSLFPFFEDFYKIMMRSGKRVELLREFKSPEDIPVFRIYKVY